MPFSNPIAAGEQGILIRDALRSRNYTNDGQGSFTGWYFDRDGNAFVSSITIGNSLYSVDSDGNATFATLSVTASDITVGGVNLIGDVISNLPTGIIGFGEFDTSVGPTSVELGIYEIAVTTDATRQYRLTLSEWFTGTVANDNINFRIRDGGASTPTLASPIVFQTVKEVTDVAPRVNYIPATVNLQFSTGLHRLLVTVRRDAGTGTVTVSGSADRPCQLFVEDMGPVQSNIANANNGGGGVTPVQKFVTTYGATWSGAYNVSNNLIGGTGTNCYQGDYANPGFNGNTRSSIGFPSTILTDLTGATLTKAELYLYYNHWYNGSGGTAIIGTHNNPTATTPATWTGGNSNRVQSASWPNPGGRWVNLGLTVGNDFKNGLARGIILGPAPSTNVLYYGKTQGANQSSEPMLRFSYTK